MTGVDSPNQSLVDSLLRYAEKAGINFGALFLLTFGLYAGQYAALFPENLRSIAGAFCLVIAGCGFAFVVAQLLKSLLKPFTGETTAKTAGVPPGQK
jgi:hypothetical protein